MFNMSKSSPFSASANCKLKTEKIPITILVKKILTGEKFDLDNNLNLLYHTSF